MSDAASDRPNEPVLRDERSDGIAVLTMARPKQRNSLSRLLLQQLFDAFDRHSGDPETRVIILAAEGPVFSAGHDMKELTAARTHADGGRAYFAETFKSSSKVMLAIARCAKPVIAQVQGMATAAGCQLVATCDLAVTARSASFATPGVDIGLFCSTPMVALSRNVPRKQAMEMLLLGEPVDAARAREIGLVNRVVDDDALASETMAIAAKISGKSQKTIMMGKQAFHTQLEQVSEDAYAHTARVMTENMLAHDAEEGIGAFLEKRAPKWTDS